MKQIFLFTLFLGISFVLSSVVLAVPATPSVDITSFTYGGVNNRIAELCGKVDGVSGVSLVHVTVDETSKTPGHYYTVVEGVGPFCLVVSTFNGTAIASIKGISSRQAKASDISAPTGR